jgi:tetratricopeptide (TPR) repeat protein
LTKYSIIIYPDETLVKFLVKRTEGNPFYIEELLKLFQEQNLRFEAVPTKTTLDKLEQELPVNLQSLILAQVDRLNENEKAVLKVASVIGRNFEVQPLQNIYNELGKPALITKELEKLLGLGIIRQEQSKVGQAFTFKHAIIQEVVYQSLIASQRETLHELTARYFETFYLSLREENEKNSSPFLDLLVYHYERTNNYEKQREYWHKAASAARESYANTTALGYYRRLFKLLAREQGRLIAHKDQYLEQLAAIQQELQTVVYSMSDLLLLTGCLTEAIELLEQSLSNELFSKGSNLSSVDLHQLRFKKIELLVQMACYQDATQEIKYILHDSSEVADKAAAFNWLATVNKLQGDYDLALTNYQYSAALHRQTNNDEGMADVLNRIGLVMQAQNNFKIAYRYYKQSIKLRNNSNKRQIANTLSNLGELFAAWGNFARAYYYHQKSLTLRQEIGDLRGVAITWTNLGIVAENKGEYELAYDYYQSGLKVYEDIGDRRNVALSLVNLGMLAVYRRNLVKAYQHYLQSESIYRSIGDKWGCSITLAGLGLIAYHESDFFRSEDYYLRALEIMLKIGDEVQVVTYLAILSAIILKKAQNDIDPTSTNRRLHYAFLLYGCVSEYIVKKQVSLQLNERIIFDYVQLVISFYQTNNETISKFLMLIGTELKLQYLAEFLLENRI